MADVPVVFVSYSHDSREHKQWVAEFASKLQHNGVDTILDQWELSPGGDVARFMESGLERADRVLVICTPEYVRKANAGAGGVGFEKMIITATLVHDLGTTKFVPVIRQGEGSGEELKPTYLGTRFHVDLRDEAAIEEEFETLLRELHQVRAVVKPPLGRNPFGVTPSGAGATPEPGSAQVPLADPAATPYVVYRNAIDLARRDDELGWRMLTKRIRRPAFEGLAAWAASLGPTAPSMADGEAEAALHSALTPLMPLIAQALAGVESGRAALKNQQAILDDILHPAGWPGQGLATIVQYPQNLAYVYQALHGATCLYTGQIDLAIALVDMKVSPQRYQGAYHPLWRIPCLIGWPKALGDNAIRAWDFLLALPDRHPWLNELFEDRRGFRTALAAYSMALNTFQFGWTLANQPDLLPSKIFELDIPPMFFFTHRELDEQPLKLLLRQPDQVRSLWRRFGIPDEKALEAWPTWMQHAKRWMHHQNRSWLSEAPHERLFEALSASSFR